MLHSTAVVQQMILDPYLSINECLGVNLNDIHVYAGTFQYNPHHIHFRALFSSTEGWAF